MFRSVPLQAPRKCSLICTHLLGVCKCVWGKYGQTNLIVMRVGTMR
jgi:hypothetical protein